MTNRNGTKKRAGRLLVVIVMVLPLLLAACNESDTEFLIELGLEYARELELLDAEGNPNLVKIGRHAFLGTTGNPEADAALEAGYVVKSVNDADNLAQQGAMEGDQEKIQAAINARPGDWSYREQQAALQIAQGDLEAAAQAIEQSNDLIDERARNGGDCSFYKLNQLRHRQQAMLTQLDRTNANSEEHQRLIEYLDRTQREITSIEQGDSVPDCN